MELSSPRIDIMDQSLFDSIMVDVFEFDRDMIMRKTNYCHQHFTNGSAPKSHVKSKNHWLFTQYGELTVHGGDVYYSDFENGFDPDGNRLGQRNCGPVKDSFWISKNDRIIDGVLYYLDPVHVVNLRKKWQRSFWIDAYKDMKWDINDSNRTVQFLV